MIDLLAYYLQYFYMSLLIFFVTGMHDATKHYVKIWVARTIAKTKGISFEEAWYYFNNEAYYQYMPDIFSHKNYWHLCTTFIWIILHIGVAVITVDWRYLLMGVNFLILDFMYYVWVRLINIALGYRSINIKYLIPETLNWFPEDSALFRFFFGKDFTRKEFYGIIIVKSIIIIAVLTYFK